MDTALVAVTLVSLGLAGTMSGVALRLLREERRRSAARVAALAAELSGAPGGDLPLRTIDPAPARPVEPGPIADAADNAASSALFATATRKGGLPRRAVVTLGVGVLMALAAGTALLTSKDGERAEPVAAASHEAPPLELLSLRHSRPADTLTITGLVRNPDGAAAMKDVTAVAFLFDRAGSFVASGRAPLDFRMLSAGDESPFVITVPVSGTIGRYRVSFRGASGAMAPHVDKRARP